MTKQDALSSVGELANAVKNHVLVANGMKRGKHAPAKELRAARVIVDALSPEQVRDLAPTLLNTCTPYGGRATILILASFGFYETSPIPYPYRPARRRVPWRLPVVTPQWARGVG